MTEQVPEKNRLTSTTFSRTVYDALERLDILDATAKKLVQRLRDLERQIQGLEDQADGIRMSLHIAGITPRIDWDDHIERQYAQSRPFASLTLVETCKRILVDFTGVIPLTKSQVEYLAARGGFTFSSKDSKNSVDVTLRRLANQGFCHAVRARGAKGNKYFCLPKEEKRLT